MSDVSPLRRAIATVPTEELKVTRTVVHRAGDRARLGWPRLLREWPDRMVRLGHFPPVLEAVCVEISAELVARGDPFGPCPPCEAAVARLAADKPPFVPSSARPDVPAGAGA